MTNWFKFEKKKGRRSTTITLRIPNLAAEALARVSTKTEGVSKSAIATTGLLKLPEVREEIATIKRERRGERREQNTQDAE